MLINRLGTVNDFLRGFKPDYFAIANFTLIQHSFLFLTMLGHSFQGVVNENALNKLLNKD